MKNLVRKYSLEELELMPIDLLSFTLQKKHRELYDRWKSKKSDSHKINGLYPWNIAIRLIENNIGKSFNDIFSKYCKLVPKYQQKWFIKEFVQERTWSWIDYVIDNNGLIQRIKPKNSYKGPYNFTSIDATYEFRDPITGHKRSEYYWIYNKYKKIDYVNVLVKGWEKKFDSKSDPLYKRLTYEKKQALKKKEKLRKKSDKERAFNFISKNEIELKKNKEVDKYKILAHGFDLETSFRTDKQTNPDLIKEKQ